ncbi:MAG: hypothetical protein P4L84_24155 [Isosphaeraceae bacterium]|nr:hypothetical protein [Isosphaeraceae bacterium]
MSELPELIRQYAALLDEESRLTQRKERLRAEILAEMDRHDVRDARYAHGSAQRVTRFKLLPRRDEVLAVLGAEDLFEFAKFSAERVKDVLVPRYGRERLLPLFDIEKSESLIVKRPPGQTAHGSEPVE